jgi:metallophosphoesterase superfamily enzyme
MRVLDDWLLTPGRVAVHLPTGTAVAADLHLGYDRVRRRNGEAVPLRPLRDELLPLALALRAYGLTRLVVAGDLFEDGRVERESMTDELMEWLDSETVELVGVVPGNHDRGLGECERLRICKEGIVLGRWLVVHGDGDRPDGPFVQGHEHPWFRWRPGVEGACYLVGDDHLVLPACSADAAGGNVIGKRRWGEYRCCVIAGGEVLDFGVLARLGSQV